MDTTGAGIPRWARPPARLVRRATQRLAGVDTLVTRVGALEERLAAADAAADAALADARLRIDSTQEAMLLAETSRQVDKRPVILLVEAPADYGNLAALGRALPSRVGSDRVAVLARDEASASRWRAEGIEAHAWTTAPWVGAAPAWMLALTSAVSVFEHHAWWRTPDRLVLRGLLAGSQQVQVWHGSAGPLDKDVAMLSSAGSPGMAEFADVFTTSTGYRAFVCEPRLAAKRRLEFQFDEQVPDVDFRMRGPLAAAPRADGPVRVLVAPTFPEGEEGARRLARRMAAYRRAAEGSDAEVHVRHHPWTPESVRSASEGLPEVVRSVDIYSVLADYDVLVTDFSSLSADMLLLGRRVVLDLTDLASYRDARALERDDATYAVCDPCDDPTTALRTAVAPEPEARREARRAHAHARLDALGAPPGENTLSWLASRVGA